MYSFKYFHRQCEKSWLKLMKVMGHEMIMPKFSYILDFVSQILDLVTFSRFFLTNFGHAVFLFCHRLWRKYATEYTYTRKNSLAQRLRWFFFFILEVKLRGISKDIALNAWYTYISMYLKQAYIQSSCISIVVSYIQ